MLCLEFNNLFQKWWYYGMFTIIKINMALWVNTILSHRWRQWIVRTFKLLAHVMAKEYWNWFNDHWLKPTMFEGSWLLCHPLVIHEMSIWLLNGIHIYQHGWNVTWHITQFVCIINNWRSHLRCYWCWQIHDLYVPLIPYGVWHMLDNSPFWINPKIVKYIFLITNKSRPHVKFSSKILF
jgi:hypothetical protein